MTNETTTIEEERMLRLQENRNLESQSTESKTSKIRATTSVKSKISDNWLILASAGFFDLIGMLPFVAPITNFLWGGILYWHFGKKNFFKKTGTTIALGSLADFFLGVLPVCLGATLVRILWTK
ncbi:MAG: hypothetical protein ABII97_01705, partial [Patescibacteria group bacterium]